MLRTDLADLVDSRLIAPTLSTYSPIQISAARALKQKGTTLLRGSALVTSKFSLSDYRALACSTPLISAKLFSYVPQSISPTLNNAEIVPSALP